LYRNTGILRDDEKSRSPLSNDAVVKSWLAYPGTMYCT